MAIFGALAATVVRIILDQWALSADSIELRHTMMAARQSKEGNSCTNIQQERLAAVEEFTIFNSIIAAY